MYRLEKWKFPALVLICLTILILIIFYFSFFSNNMILSESNIKKNINSKIGYDVKILKNEENKNYKIILFQADKKLGIATYKFNILSHSIGSDYIFAYNSMKNNSTINTLIKENDSYNYAILQYGDNQKEIIIYGNNSNKSFESIDINETSSYKIKLNNQDIFFVNRIIGKNTPAKITLNANKSSIKIFEQPEE